MRCDGCGEWIWILYREGRPNSVFSAKFPLGMSTSENFILHRDATPSCKRNIRSN